MNVNFMTKLFDDRQLNGYHLGRVEDIEDLGYKNGEPIFRVKVKVFGITDNIPVDDLPYYIVKQPLLNTYNNIAKIPPVGSSVYVEFPYRDIYNGIVTFQLY